MLALILAYAPSAGANNVTYWGKLGKTFVSFKLVGKNCPKGPHCFDHARVVSFQVVVYSFPNCPQILENAVNFDDVNKHGVSVHMKGHSFSGSGSVDGEIHLAFEGRFIHHGFRAEGSYKIDDRMCTTGRRNWSLPIYHGP